jgi:hypothetical protein
MIGTAIRLTGKRIALATAKVGRFASQFLLLSLALVCYGTVPSPYVAQTEYETPVQEELAAHASSHCDLKSRLRGAAQRRTGATLDASACKKTCYRAVETAAVITPRLSLGLSLPLRC